MLIIFSIELNLTIIISLRNASSLLIFISNVYLIDYKQKLLYIFNVVIVVTSFMYLFWEKHLSFKIYYNFEFFGEHFFSIKSKFYYFSKEWKFFSLLSSTVHLIYQNSLLRRKVMSSMSYIFFKIISSLSQAQTTSIKKKFRVIFTLNMTKNWFGIKDDNYPWPLIISIKEVHDLKTFFLILLLKILRQKNISYI